jgi:subtilisin family serine protease
VEKHPKFTRETMFISTKNRKNFAISGFALLILVFVAFDGLYAQSGGGTSAKAVPGQLIIKLAPVEGFEALNKSRVPGQRTVFSAEQTLEAVQSALAAYQLTEVNQAMTKSTFEELRVEQLQRVAPGQLPTEVSDDLVRTYFLNYASDVDPFYLASKIQSIPGVEYAEPQVEMELHYDPNDPLYGTNGQNYFEIQRFNRAWNLTKSSRDIIIAIVDSGVDYKHPDLRDNLWRNPDPGRAKRLFPGVFSAVENDTIGWNFWASGPISNPVQNANPIGTAQSHGTHVAGIAAAISDNGIGLASAGFNSTYMPVRAGGTEEAPRSIGYGYQGILYAAVNGAHVINCSFGSDFNSQFGEDVINIATELGSVIVGSAGNNNNEVLNYPAAYENVLSVASVVTSTRAKSSFSSYGYSVDVAATGSSILSTVFNNSYALNSGTSMSAPVVSGLAALVVHQHPTWTAERVIGQIRGTATSTVYLQNPMYTDKLGGGLIDAEKAIAGLVPVIRIAEARFVNEDGLKLGIDEEGFIELDLVNYGQGSRNLSYSIVNTNQTANLLTGNGIITQLFAEGTETTIRVPVTITENALQGELPLFKVQFVDDENAYVDFRYIRFENLLVETHDANMVIVSATSTGAIGFNRTVFGDTGVGFIPIREVNGSLQELGNMLYESGVIIETNLDENVHMLTNVRETNYPPSMFNPIKLFEISDMSDGQSGLAYFDSENEMGRPHAEIRMETFAFDDPALEQSLLVYYHIRNVDPSRLAMNDTYVGMFSDWDVGNYSNNRVRYNAADSVMVLEDPTSPSLPFVTVAHLGGISSAMAIDNAYEGTVDSLNFGIYYSTTNSAFDGFTPDEKSWSLKAGLGKNAQTPSDVSLVNASGPFTIRYNQEITVGFVFSFGDTEADLIEQVRAARQRGVYQTTPNFNAPRVPVFIPTEIAIAGNYPNPFNPTTNLLIDMERPGRAIVEIYDLMGRKVSTIFDEELNNRRYEVIFDGTGLASGVYVAVLRTDQGVKTRKITLLK